MYWLGLSAVRGSLIATLLLIATPLEMARGAEAAASEKEPLAGADSAVETSPESEAGVSIASEGDLAGGPTPPSNTVLTLSRLATTGPKPAPIEPPDPAKIDEAIRRIAHALM